MTTNTDLEIVTCPSCGGTGKLPVDPICKKQPAKGQLRLAIVGEMPDQNGEMANLPMVGKPYDLLKGVMEGGGYNLDAIYFTNLCCCHFPKPKDANGKDKDIPNDIIEKATPRLKAELKEFNPDRILLLGNAPVKALLGFDKNVSNTHRVWHVIELNGREVSCISTWHPATVLKATKLYTEFVTDTDALKSPITTFQSPQVIVPVTEMDAIAAIHKYLRYGAVDKDTGLRVVDIETTGLDYRIRDILCLGISPNPTLSVIFTDAILGFESVRLAIQNLTLDRHITFAGHNACAFDEPWCKYHLGIDFKIKWDSILLHYLLDERVGTHAIEVIAQSRYGIPDWCKEMHKHLDDLWGYRDAPRGKLYHYLAMDTAVGHMITQDLITEISLPENKKLLEVYFKLYAPAARMLAQVKANGILIDVEYLKALDKEWGLEIETLKLKLQDIAGRYGLDKFKLQ